MKAVAAFLGVLIFGYMMLIFSDTVGASDANKKQWTATTPVVMKSISTPIVDGVRCPAYAQDITVQGIAHQVNACVYGAEALRLAISTVSGAPRAAVAFAYDTQMHRLEGVCADQRCQYIASKDMLVVGQQGGVEGESQLFIYAHVSQRIHPTSAGVTKGVMYTFDASSPEYVMKNDTGQYVAVGSYAVSNNGEWLALELLNKGVAIMNTTTLESRQISISGYRYGNGADPIEELAVSNDGKSVIVTGLNADFMIFDVVAGCEQRFVGTMDQIIAATPCPGTDLGIHTLFPGLRVVHRPLFNDSGDAFSLELVMWDDYNGRKVTIAAESAAAHSAVGLLALGDSFISGEGENDESYYLPRTNDGSDNCHVSRRAYPFLVGAQLGLAPSNIKSVACAGARIRDITMTTKDYQGQNDRLAHHQISLEEQKSITRDFLPGHIAQSTFVAAHMPGVITVGVGGNDAGLMGKLKVCAMPGTCEWAVAENRHKTATEIKSLFNRLVALYEELVRASPVSRIYAFGYPEIINPYGVCDPITSLLFTSDERVYMQESIRYLNQVISMAAAQAGVKYVEVQDAFARNRLCDGLTSTAMNGVVIGDDAAVISALPQLKVIGSGSFHPKPAGHSLIADLVTQTYPALGEYLWCGGDALTCPINIGPPEPGMYWQAVGAHDEIRSYSEEFASIVNAIGDRLRIQLRTASLLPGSVVRFEIHSDPFTLGTLTVDQFGSVNGEVVVPTSIQPGAHTLHAFGTSRDGTLIDLYQSIDIDEEGRAVSMPSVELTDSSSKNTAAMARAGSVLGAQTQHASVGRPTVSPLSQAPNDQTEGATARVSGNTWVWIGGIAGLIGLVLSVLFLIWRRWVKRIRSV